MKQFLLLVLISCSLIAMDRDVETPPPLPAQACIFPPEGKTPRELHGLSATVKLALRGRAKSTYDTGLSEQQNLENMRRWSRFLTRVAVHIRRGVPCDETLELFIDGTNIEQQARYVAAQLIVLYADVAGLAGTVEELAKQLMAYKDAIVAASNQFHCTVFPGHAPAHFPCDEDFYTIRADHCP